MGGKRMPQGTVFQIRDTKLLTGGLYQLIDSRVMHVTDTWKQVMFHLKI